jgi:hypothetical protein
MFTEGQIFSALSSSSVFPSFRFRICVLYSNALNFPSQSDGHRGDPANQHAFVSCYKETFINVPKVRS